MKKTVIAFAILTGMLASCTNQDIEFPDYGYTTGYFPYQYPVRTLLLGNDILYDNSNDNAHTFIVSVTMGGVYKNTKDRTLSFRVDNSLCDNVLFKSSGEPLKPLPDNYYTLSSGDRMVIKSGNVNGGVEVHLTDAFFNDPEAIGLTYVLPLRLTGTDDLDSLLNGNSLLSNPDPRASGDWSIVPKDFTITAVKFRNAYDGTFLHRGQTVASGAFQSTVSYRRPYVENDDQRVVSTTGRSQVGLSVPVRVTGLTGTVDLQLNFPDGTGTADCSITGTATFTDADRHEYTAAVSGKGRFVNGGEQGNDEEWGGKKRDALFLNYQFTDAVNNITGSSVDTLVLRDRSRSFEIFEIAFP
jgi:hypothetical protein